MKMILRSAKSGTKRSISKSLISTSSSSETYSNWKWVCPCKGANWSPDIPNRSWLCDICGNAEDEICLRKNGFDDKYINGIASGETNFHCRKCRVIRNTDANTNAIKKKKTEAKAIVDDDDDWRPGDDVATSSANDGDAFILSLHSTSDSNGNTNNNRNNKKKIKKKTMNKSKNQLKLSLQKNKKQSKLTQSDHVRENALSAEALQDGLARKNQLIAAVQNNIYDPKLRRVVLIMMKNKLQKGSWVRTTDKLKKYTQGGGPKPRWDSKEFASRIGALGFILNNNEDIMKMDGFNKLWCITNGLDNCIWFASGNVAPILHYQCFQEVLTFRKPKAVQDKIEGLGKKATNKYDGMHNWFETFKTQYNRLNIEATATHFRWAEASKQANRQLRAEAAAMKNQNKKGGKTKPDEEDDDLFGKIIDPQFINNLTTTMGKAVDVLGNMNNNKSVKTKYHRKKRMFDTNKLKPKPIKPPLKSLCSSGSDADVEDSDNLAEKQLKNDGIIVSFHSMQKIMAKAFIQYLKLNPPAFERPVLMICMEGMANRRIQRAVYSKFCHAKQITTEPENIMQIMATGVFNLCPEINEAEYRKKWA